MDNQAGLARIAHYKDSRPAVKLKPAPNRQRQPQLPRSRDDDLAVLTLGRDDHTRPFAKINPGTDSPGERTDRRRCDHAAPNVDCREVIKELGRPHQGNIRKPQRPAREPNMAMPARGRGGMLRKSERRDDPAHEASPNRGPRGSKLLEPQYV